MRGNELGGALGVLLLALVSCLVVTPACAASVRVVDGDTIQLAGKTIRLHGIDAPEAGQLCNGVGGGQWRCGDEATRHLESLIGDDVPICDHRGTDDYDRVLAVCTVQGVELNRTMVTDGYAWAFRKYSQDYVGVEEEAARRRVGVWQAMNQTAWDYRAARWDAAAQEAPEGCPIKGNISKNGRIYHAPWSPWYSKTRVSVRDGERWFCSEREALDSGWRAPIWGR